MKDTYYFRWPKCPIHVKDDKGNKCGGEMYYTSCNDVYICQDCRHEASFEYIQDRSKKSDAGDAEKTKGKDRWLDSWGSWRY